MTRQLLASCLGCCLLVLLPVLDARAVEMPVRKAGLWEMKIVRTGSQLPEMTMQHCTDEATDKAMSTGFAHRRFVGARRGRGELRQHKQRGKK